MASRREFLESTLAAAGIVVAPAAAPAALQALQAPQTFQDASSRTAATLVLTNGRIHTLDARGTVAPSVVIRGGRFVSVGGATPAAGPGVRVIDLRGRTVVPGLI